MWCCFCDPTFSRFSRTPTCGGQTDGRTDRGPCIASRVKSIGDFDIDTVLKSIADSDTDTDIAILLVIACHQAPVPRARFSKLLKIFLRSS